MKAILRCFVRLLTRGRYTLCESCDCYRVVPVCYVGFFAELCDACFFADDGPAHHWLCDCGAFIEDGLHCPRCGAEPPWGCPCELHDLDAPEDDYDPWSDYSPEDEEVDRLENER